MNFKYYKTDRLIIFLLVLSVIYNYVSNFLEDFIKQYPFFQQIYSYVGVFSTLTLITLTIIVIDIIGWKYKAFTWLVDIPNLNGRYKGELISSYQSSPGVFVNKLFVMEIKQTASKLYIFSYFGDLSNNTSTSSSINVSEQITPDQNNNSSNLFYIFSNETSPLLNLNNHTGTAKLKYFKDAKKLEGEYFNQRGNTGKIEVVFEQKKLLGRLNR
mgnify:CR=1 FL=1|jgi:hypothetical protein